MIHGHINTSQLAVARFMNAQFCGAGSGLTFLAAAKQCLKASKRGKVKRSNLEKSIGALTGLSLARVSKQLQKRIVSGKLLETGGRIELPQVWHHDRVDHVTGWQDTPCPCCRHIMQKSTTTHVFYVKTRKKWNVNVGLTDTDNGQGMHMAQAMYPRISTYVVQSVRYSSALFASQEMLKLWYQVHVLGN